MTSPATALLVAQIGLGVRLFDLVVFALLGLLSGFLSFVLVPFVASAGPLRVRQRVHDWYNGMATTVLERFVIVVVGSKGLKLRRSEHDVHKEAEQSETDGETIHATDHLQVGGRLDKRRFAFLDFEVGLLVDALWSEVGEQFGRLRQNDLLSREVTHVDEDGETVGTRREFSDLVPISERPRLVDLRGFRELAAGSAGARAGERAYENAKKSQEKFHNRVSTGQALIIGGAFVAGGLMVWFVANFGEAASEGVSNPIPVPNTVAPVGLELLDVLATVAGTGVI